MARSRVGKAKTKAGETTSRVARKSFAAKKLSKLPFFPRFNRSWNFKQLNCEIEALLSAEASNIIFDTQEFIFLKVLFYTRYPITTAHTASLHLCDYPRQGRRRKSFLRNVFFPWRAAKRKVEILIRRNFSRFEWEASSASSFRLLPRAILCLSRPHHEPTIPSFA